MLPTRASANSLSAPIKSSSGFRDSLEEKSKGNIVQIKGRFSVTSESLDLVQDIHSATSRRSSQVEIVASERERMLVLRISELQARFDFESFA
ncbi:hypothetical protein Droror1_Dr00023500 [Drosera rotundifolia]